MTVTSLALVGLSLLIQQSDTITSKHQAWKTALIEATKGSEVGVVIDVPSQFQAPTIKSERQLDRQKLLRLGQLLERRISYLDTCSVLARPELSPSVNQISDGGSILAGLLSMGEAGLRRLSSDGMDLSEMSEECQGAIAKLCMANSGLFQKTLDGARIHVNVFANPVIRFQNQATGTPKTFALGDFAISSPKNIEARKKATHRVALSNGNAASQPLPSSGKNEVDFKDGELFTIRELVRKIRKDLLWTVTYDERLAESVVFVRGRFDREGIVLAIAEVCKAQKPRSDPWTRESRSERINQALRSVLGETSFDQLDGLGDFRSDEFSGAKEIELQDLIKRSPKIAAGYKGLGIDTSVSITLEMRLGISIFADGFAPLPGQQSSILSPNWIQFRIES